MNFHSHVKKSQSIEYRCLRTGIKTANEFVATTFKDKSIGIPENRWFKAEVIILFYNLLNAATEFQYWKIKAVSTKNADILKLCTEKALASNISGVLGIC